jgi:hypothetical protein
VQYKLFTQNYLQEAIWSSKKYSPSLKEHEDLSIMTSGLPMLTIMTLMGYGDEATQEAFEWVSTVPEMVRASAHVTRLLNDLSSYKVHTRTISEQYFSHSFSDKRTNLDQVQNVLLYINFSKLCMYTHHIYKPHTHICSWESVRSRICLAPWRPTW